MKTNDEKTTAWIDALLDTYTDGGVARVITMWIEAIAHAVDTQAGIHAPDRENAEQ